MSIKEMIIWIYDGFINYEPSFVRDKETIQAIKDFKGICCFHKTHWALERFFDNENNIYESGHTLFNQYLGERGTNRQYIDETWMSKNVAITYIDESSPRRLDVTASLLEDVDVKKKFGYSSYRMHLFSIFTKKTDWNFRLALLSPLGTIKRLHKVYGDKLFIWIALDRNQEWGFNWFHVPIPFNYHVRRMKKFAEKNNIQILVYGGNKMNKQQFLSRLKRFVKVFNTMGEK